MRDGFFAGASAPAGRLTKEGAMACELRWEPEGVLARFSGVIGGPEFLAAVARIQSDPRFDDAHYVIHDLSAATPAGLGENTLIELAALHLGACASTPNCRIVFVGCAPTLAANILKILMAPLAMSYEVAVHADVEAARDWLAAQPQLLRMSDVMGYWRP